MYVIYTVGTLCLFDCSLTILLEYLNALLWYLYRNSDSLEIIRIAFTTINRDCPYRSALPTSTVELMIITITLNHHQQLQKSVIFINLTNTSTLAAIAITNFHSHSISHPSCDTCSLKNKSMKLLDYGMHSML